MLPKNKIVFLGLPVALSIIGYLLIGYHIQRVETAKLLTTFCVLFTCYLYIANKKNTISIKTIITLGILFRLIFLFSIPALSDDFYRFIWDGRLWFNGINPFAHTPIFYAENPSFSPDSLNKNLYNLLNSPTHYTVYPPIPQFIHWVAAWIASDSIWLSVVIIRIAHLMAEIATLYLLPTVLSSFSINKKNSIWYALNPLLIVELVGNLHHEALMIFFILLFLLYFQKAFIYQASFALAMAVASKLLPLMFLPFILLKTDGRKRALFLLLFITSLAFIFYPLIDHSFFIGIKKSLLLYYQHFEFNAGIYYTIREVGYWIKGYNTIASIGKFLSLFTTLAILAISIIAYYKKWKLAHTLLWISTIFSFFSIIFHPWYITLMLFFSIMTPYRFTILWSGLITLTYAGYSSTGFEEVMPIVSVEYIAVLAMLWYEIKEYKKQPL